MKLTTACLDAGGVLVHPGWPRISGTLRRYGVEISAAALAAAEPRAKRALDVAEGARERERERGWRYFHMILEEAGVAITPAVEAGLAELRDYQERENLWELVPADVRPTLRRLRALGLTLVVISNANGRLRHLFDRLGLTGDVDVLIDSHEEGYEKPDPRLFEIALDRAHATPGTAVYVGDLYHVDIVGARHAGIPGVLLDVAGLYPDADCPTIRRVADFPAWLTRSLVLPERGNG